MIKKEIYSVNYKRFTEIYKTNKNNTESILLSLIRNLFNSFFDNKNNRTTLFFVISSENNIITNLMICKMNDDNKLVPISFYIFRYKNDIRYSTTTNKSLLYDLQGENFKKLFTKKSDTKNIKFHSIVKENII